MPTTSPPEAPHQPPVLGKVHGRHRWWRWVAGVVAVLLVVFVGAAWYFSGRIYSGALISEPGSFPPPYDDAKIVAVNSTELTFQKGPDAGPSYDAPALYGLAWDGGTGLVSPAFVNADGSVTREVVQLTSGVMPTAGQMAAFERAYWLGDPAVSYDPVETNPDHTDVVVDGRFPAWFFDNPGVPTQRMAIVVHGQNGLLSDGLRVADVLARSGADLPLLDITYRNDAGAPADPSGRLQYGATEWQDLDAAVTWARDKGARDIVLIGQSMGGAIVAAFLENSDQADVVS